MPTQGHAAVLSIETERTDMRFQWIARVLADPLLDSVSVILKRAVRPCLA
jgi:hypothetical protein